MPADDSADRTQKTEKTKQHVQVNTLIDHTQAKSHVNFNSHDDLAMTTHAKKVETTAQFNPAQFKSDCAIEHQMREAGYCPASKSTISEPANMHKRTLTSHIPEERTDE